MVVTSIHNGDYIKVQGVDFSKGAVSFEACVASQYGREIEIHNDKVDGPVLGVVAVTASGEGDIYKTITAPVRKTKGVHDVYFVFKGGEGQLFNFDWWKFR